MGQFKIFTWNMRGATVKGDPEAKVILLENLIYGISPGSGSLEYPVFFLQEAGDMESKIGLRPLLKNNYSFKFVNSIGAVGNRCTTGLMIPQWLSAAPVYDICSQESGVRCHVSAKIQIDGKDIRLASIHTVSSRDAVADGVRMLRTCCEHPYFAAGGDFNCLPSEMLCEKHFTDRGLESKYRYQVMEPVETTHRTASSGEERKLDFICVKGLSSTKGERWFGAQKRGDMYSDHWPVLYRITF